MVVNWGKKKFSPYITEVHRPLICHRKKKNVFCLWPPSNEGRGNRNTKKSSSCGAMKLP